MPVLDQQHDFAHPVEDESAWSESYYFNCYDPDTDVGFFCRVGVRPNEGRMESFIVLWLPNGEMARLSGISEQHEMIDTNLGSGGLEFERIKAMQHWQVRGHGDAKVWQLGSKKAPHKLPLHFQVDFHALSDAMGVDGQTRKVTDKAALAVTASVAKGHLEQAGKWTGTIRLGESEYNLSNARGNRDKSWGARRHDGGVAHMWRWFSINVGDDFHIGGIKVDSGEGAIDKGWVWYNGSHQTIKKWQISTELESDGLTQKRVHLAITDKAGVIHELEGEVLRVFPMPSDKGGVKSVVNEGLTRWTHKNNTGYGIAEYQHRFDADGKPLVNIE